MSTCDWISAPAHALRGEVIVPGDKSVSHRAVMLAAIADGHSRIDGFLEGEDTRATAAIFGQMGVSIDAPSPSRRVVKGVGLHGLEAPSRPLDCGNAGTGMRLLTGLLAGQRFASELGGDASLSRRPMRRIIDPLLGMGAAVESNGGLPPLRLRPAPLHGIDYRVPIASAQVKSAVLLAGLYADGETCVREAHPTRDYTESMLAAFGWPIEFGPGFARLRGGHRLRGMDIIVPADFSSAAFFIVAATIVPGSDIVLRGVGISPRRIGLVDVLRRMGASIAVNTASGGGIGDIHVRHAPLTGIEVPAEAVSDMIDEFPAFFVAAAAAFGTTTIRGAAELRVKESDRIAVMATGLAALGIAIRETHDGAIIEGGVTCGGLVDSGGDHRCAMAFAVAGAIATDVVRIADCANVATSFPGFDRLACSLGMTVTPAIDRE